MYLIFSLLLSLYVSLSDESVCLIQGSCRRGTRKQLRLHAGDFTLTVVGFDFIF